MYCFFWRRAFNVSTLVTSGMRRVLFLFMNNAFAIGIADTELVYIITINAGAVIRDWTFRHPRGSSSI